MQAGTAAAGGDGGGPGAVSTRRGGSDDLGRSTDGAAVDGSHGRQSPPQQHQHQHQQQGPGQLFLDLGKPLNCMSVARHPGASLVAAVGGAQMLKLVSITPHGLAETRSLRLTSKVTSEVNFSINDVEWCCKDAARHVLASGASNGHILLWDVSRDGRTSQERVIPAHPRTVNRINWHPQEEDLLLSASQDTTVKLWDRRGRLYDCQAVFHPRAESVRDVQWNPTQVHLFAAACENGSVQLWDRRKPGSTPLLRIMGHNGLVLALEWHLTEPFLLATGARDRTVKVWDVSDQTRDDLKERHVINTVSAVSRIKWRPGHPEQLTTTSSVQGDNAIHLWNVQHPHLPLFTLEGHDDVCGSITWVDTPCLPQGAGEGLGGGQGSGPASEGPTSGSSLGSSGEGGGAGSGHYRSMSARLFGAWGGGWGDSFGGGARDEDKKGLEQYTEYLAVWQHLLSCGRDGKVIFHSLARATRPRETLTPTVLALSARGEAAMAYERIDRSLAFVGLVDDERTREAPGIFAAQPNGEQGGVLAREEPLRGGSAGSEKAAAAALPAAAPAVTSSPRMLHGSTSLSAAGRQQQHQHAYHPAIPMSRSASAPVSHHQHQHQHQAERLGASPVLGALPHLQPPLPTPEPHLASTGKTSSADSAAGGLLAGSACSASSIHHQHLRPRSLYRLRWDEAALRGSSTAEVAAALERVMLVHEAELGEDGAAPAVLRGPDQVAHLARHYVLRPRGVSLPLPSVAACQRAREDLCQHNAEVARVGGQLRMAHVWEVLAVLLTGHQGVLGLGPPDDDPYPENGGGFDYATGRPRSAGGPPVGNPQQPASPPSPGDGLGAAGACLQLLRRELLTGVAEELLEEGDVQNAVALFEVLASTSPAGDDAGGEGLAELVDVGKERVRECYLGYVELLHRLELWQAAAELVRGVEDKAVRQLHATNTTTYASCAQCRRPVGTVETPQGPRPSPWCGKCRALVSQCAICLQPVRGVYVWCPACGHGGHVTHMQSWFAQGHAECPTGCGHQCHLFASPPPPPLLLVARNSGGEAQE